MHGINVFRVGLFCLLTAGIMCNPQAAPSFSFGFSSNSPNDKPRTTTNRPWGNIGAYKPGIKVERNFNNTGNGYNYSYSYSYSSANNPASSGYYLGGAPGTGWPSTSNLTGMPYSTSPYAGQMPQGSASGQPRVEVSVSETNPYEQQNVVYTVRVVSNNNLKILNPVLPTAEGASLEIVDGPVPSARKAARNGASEIVNTYRMKLTPLRSGEIVIQPIRFKGTQVSTSRQWGMRPGASAAGDESFDISSGSPLTLRVKPADPAVEPWLPLQDLQLQTSLQEGQPAREGIPVTLTIDLVAKGALGDQLPSLESQLKSKYFRVYRESTTTKKGISNNGKYLIGSRHETYTLIPLKDGPIHLPKLGVAWWDVNQEIPKIAGEADRSGYAAAARGGQISPDSGDSSAFPAYFWFPLLITIGLIIGYWLGAWARTRPVFRNTITGAVNLLQPLKMHRARAWLSMKRSLSLNRYLNQLRMSVASVMPMQIKLWMCTRCVEQENNPGEWCYNFKNRICQHLGISSHTPLPEVAEKLIAANPHLEPDKIRAMVRSLDAAMYGGEQLDFMAWKRDLSNQLRPRARRRKRFSLRTKTTLPELNPRSA